MALIKCEECGKEISDKAIVCPHCGITFFEKKSKVSDVEQISKKQLEDDAEATKLGAIVLLVIGLGILISILTYNHFKYPGLEYFKSDSENIQLSDGQIKEKESQALLWSQFSKIDGSHAALVAKVKNSMHNPDSFEHVDTVYYWTDESKQSAGDKITVKMTYRGTNGFGGIVTETVIAQVDTHGNVLEIVR